MAGKRLATAIRPSDKSKPLRVRFETPSGPQAQVDFARFITVLEDEPGMTRNIWLFSMRLAKGYDANTLRAPLANAEPGPTSRPRAIGRRRASMHNLSRGRSSTSSWTRSAKPEVEAWPTVRPKGLSWPRISFSWSRSF